MILSFRTFNHNNELDDQRHLFKECFPELIGTAVVSKEYYFWKFHSFPGSITSYEYAACQNDKIIGYYAALPYKYFIKGQIMAAGMVCDVMTSPSLRGKGIFTKLGQYAINNLKSAGVDFTTGYPIRPEVFPGHLKIDWKIAFNLPLYIKPLKCNPILENSFVRFIIPLVNFFLLIYRILWRIKFSWKKKPDYEYKIIGPEDLYKIENYTPFYESWRQSINHVLIKDKEFLKWRLGAPSTQYKIIVIYKNENIVGLAILRDTIIRIRNIHSLAILDIMILPKHFSCLPLLHRQIEKLAEKYEVDGIIIMASKIWAKNYRLFSNGFLKTPHFFTLIIKKLNDSIKMDSFIQEKNWHLMWIDSDDL
jgi:GNAT superfamily N-acetyltransferase